MGRAVPRRNGAGESIARAEQRKVERSSVVCDKAEALRQLSFERGEPLPFPCGARKKKLHDGERISAADSYADKKCVSPRSSGKTCRFRVDKNGRAVPAPELKHPARAAGRAELPFTVEGPVSEYMLHAVDAARKPSALRQAEHIGRFGRAFGGTSRSSLKGQKIVGKAPGPFGAASIGTRHLFFPDLSRLSRAARKSGSGDRRSPRRCWYRACCLFSAS